MSKALIEKRTTIPQLVKLKGERPIVVLTAYTAPMAAILDAHVDILLVGDSIGMALYGMPSTLGVTLEMMLEHTKAVMRASKRAAVILDMPFATYQESPAQAFRNCARALAEAGAQAVKLEGGAELADTVRFLTSQGIPVMAHVGLMPQRVNTYGGYKRQGKTDRERNTILKDAVAMEKAGAFAVLMECVEPATAKTITQKLSVPTIGIGSGAGCDGQVLVAEDMLGMFEHTASFVHQYANLRGVIDKAVKAYAADVRAGKYPK